MTGTVAAILLWAILGRLQLVIPPGTALPISLDYTLDARKAMPGEPISGTIAQDVPLGDRGRIREGSHVTGHVVEAGTNPDGSSYIRIRFDQLQARGWAAMPIITTLRAVASPWEVQEAHLPRVGSMIAPDPAYWTTYQVGGDTVLRGGGPVMHGHVKIGEPTPGVSDGVMVQLISVQQPGCTTENGGPRMALWVFGSAACGSYGFRHLDVGHAGNSDPIGDIVLRSDGNVHVPTGSGLLLIAIRPRAIPMEASGDTPPAPAGLASPAQARVDAISTALATGGITTIEILQLPGRVEPGAQVTPEMLERNFLNKVVIRDITQMAYRDVFVKAFQSTHATSGTGSDLRWGVIFYSPGGARVGAIYFDKLGQQGAVDGYPVLLDGDFFAWLDHAYSNVFNDTRRAN
jgi:hypothetical protein